MNLILDLKKKKDNVNDHGSEFNISFETGTWEPFKDFSGKYISFLEYSNKEKVVKLQGKKYTGS